MIAIVVHDWRPLHDSINIKLEQNDLGGHPTTTIPPRFVFILPIIPLLVVVVGVDGI